MLTVFAFLVLLGFVGASFCLLYILVFRNTDTFERAHRVLAVGFSLILYFAAGALNISMPQLVMLSFDPTGGYLTNFLLILFPAGLGWLVTTITFRYLGRIADGNTKAIIFLIIVLSIVAFVSIDALWQSIFVSESSAQLLPNASFVLGVIGTMLFGDSYSIISNSYYSSFGDRSESTTEIEDSDWRTKL